MAHNLFIYSRLAKKKESTSKKTESLNASSDNFASVNHLIMNEDGHNEPDIENITEPYHRGLCFAYFK